MKVRAACGKTCQVNGVVGASGQDKWCIVVEMNVVERQEFTY
jgi:hypothetical protein